MFHPHSSWLDLPPFPLPQCLSSSLLPSHIDEQTQNRLAIQSPHTGYEPNTTVEISSTEVRRTSSCSVYNSSEDATTPVSSEESGRQSIGRLTSPLLMQKREASAVPASIYHTTGENSMSSSAHTRCTVRLVTIYSHKRKSSRDPRSVQETRIASERIRRHPCQDSLKWNFTRDCLLKSKKNQVLFETKSEMIMY